MTYCPQCGTENEPSARFCLKCGEELAVKTEARDVSEGRGKATVVLLVLLGFVGLALVGVCAVGGVALFQRYQEEMRVRHYTQGIQAVDTREWDVAVSELQQAGDYLDAEEKLGYAEEQLGRLLVLYERGMTHFDAGEYWDAAWWLGQAADMDPDYKDANESLEYARQQIGKILYVVKDSRGQHLLVMDADGRNQREVFAVGPEAGDLGLTAISGDAARVLVRSQLYDGVQDRNIVDLYAMDLAAGNVTQLATDANVAWGKVSGDGGKVVFRVKQGPSSPQSLYFADFDGRNERVLATASGLLLGFFASSDGDRILVSASDADWKECTVYSTDALGQTYHEVMKREGSVCYAYMSWDMNYMVIVTLGPEEHWALHAADKTGLHMTEVMSGETGYLFFDPWYSSDSDEFVFGVRPSSDVPTAYYSAAADGSNVRALPLQTGQLFAYPELSPTLNYALYAASDDGTGEHLLWIAVTNTGRRTTLSNSPGQFECWQSFSLDERKVVYPEKISEGQTAIYVSNLDGSERQLVAYGDRPVWLWPRQ